MSSSAKLIKIAVDCLGGDNKKDAELLACLSFVAKHERIKLILVLDEQKMQFLKHNIKPVDVAKIELIEAHEAIEMQDSIEVALRRKKKSSLRLALEELKNKNVEACVSSGNTAALVALSHYLLKMLKGFNRPALAGFIPNFKDSYTTMLDLGGTLDCTSLDLLQFAIMGCVLVSVMKNIDNPTCGLLNVGKELNKGTLLLKETRELMEKLALQGDLNFVGNVESGDIFTGDLDVVVCDGLLGNIALKSMEGMSNFIRKTLEKQIKKSFLNKLFYLLIASSLKENDHRKYNGAVLLGLNGLVFKSHGSADAFAFEQALDKAYIGVKNNLLEQIGEKIEKFTDILSQT